MLLLVDSNQLLCICFTAWGYYRLPF